MTNVDIATIEYSAALITDKGTPYKLENVITSLAWEEQEGQLAQKASMTVSADCEIEGESILALFKINCPIQITADWGDGSQKIFEGTVWDWSYTHGQQRQLSITAYDPMIRLQKSKDYKYYSKGMTTQAIIKKICDDWWVPLNYKWGQEITHEKKAFKNKTVSEMIKELLDEVHQQKNKDYIALYRDGKLEINSYGTNEDVYVLEPSDSISISNKLSLDSLVTRVKVLGKADTEGRASVEAVVDGKIEFGVLQEIVQRDNDKDLSKAKAEANTIISEKGTPTETITMTAPDLPFMRKGDAVAVRAGNMDGMFYILGISHNATQRQMTLTLKRQPETDKKEDTVNKQSNSEDKSYKVGDSIILNGPVYRDSYGTGKGRTFTDYKSTITIVAPTERNCPYHIGTVGWVYPDELTRA